MITITDDLERSNSRLQTPRILSAHSGHKLPLKTDRKLYIVYGKSNYMLGFDLGELERSKSEYTGALPRNRLGHTCYCQIHQRATTCHIR